MRNPNDDKLLKFLILWYGLYQFVHIFVNIRGLFLLFKGKIDFPAPPPPNGWSPQALHFFTGIATLDLLNALLALLFVYGFFRRTTWRWLSGISSLSISLYAALVFDYATIASGAWTPDNLFSYLFINITYLPVIALFFLMLARIVRKDIS